jgi:antitoxin (DNA-binding transcriptional repressor) of toxin-antitoxin stability system
MCNSKYTLIQENRSTFAFTPLNDQLSEIRFWCEGNLIDVYKGEKILITDRDRVIATILPVERGEEDSKVLSLVKEGFAAWRGGKPAGSHRAVRIEGKTVSEIVLEDRG